MKLRPGRQQGAAIGLVTNLNDPEQFGRIQVRLPGVDDEVQSWWARIAATQGGGSRGNFIRPEVGDEVLIMFEQGEANQPVVVGVLWNGQDAPPGPGNADGKNDAKWIQTRSGHQFTFNDGDDGGFIDFHDAKQKLHTKFDVPGKHITWTADDGFIRIEAPKGKVRFECTTFNLKSSEKTDVQVTNGHSVKVTGSRSTTVKTGSLTQAAGASIGITTPNLSVSAQVLTASVGGAGVNVGKVDATVKPKLSVEYKGPVTRTVGQMSLKVDNYYQTNEGNPSGPLTINGANLKVDSKGALLFQGGAGVTLTAGMARFKGGQLNLAKDGGQGKGPAPGGSVNLLGGLLLLNPSAITMPATKFLDTMMSADFHTTGPGVAVPPLPPIPLFPYMGSGPLLLGFKTDVLVNFMPAMGGGSVAVGMHVPPMPPPPWVPIPLTFRGMAVAGITALLMAPLNAALESVRGAIAANKASESKDPVERVGGSGQNNPHFFKRMADILMTSDTVIALVAAMLPFPLFNGSIGIAAPSVQVGGAPAGLTMLPFSLGCSDIPIMPNANVMGFSNVLVGVDLASVAEQFLWQSIKSAAGWLVAKGVNKAAEPSSNSVESTPPADLDNQTRPLQRQNPPDQATTTGDPVDVVSGARVDADVDVSLPGPLPLVLTRQHNSVAAACRLGGALGHGWRLNHETFLTVHRAETLDAKPNSPLLNPELERLRAAASLRMNAGAEDVERFARGYWAWHTPDLRMVRLPLLAEDGDWYFDPVNRVEFCKVGTDTYDITDAGGRVWRFAGSADGAAAWLVRCSDGLGNAWYVDRHEDGTAERIVDGAGRVVALDHKVSKYGGLPARRLHAIRLETVDGDPFPQVLRSYRYDALGRMVATAGADGVETTYSYDEDDRVTRRGEPDGYAWFWHYDMLGRVTETYGDDLRYRFHFDYQPAAFQTVVKDHRDRLTRYTYDPVTSRVSAVLDPEGGMRTWVFDANGNETESVDADGRTVARAYDDRGRLVEETNPGGGVSTWRYDHRGWLMEHTDAGGATTRWRRDARGNAIQVRHPDGTETLTRFDDVGRPVAGVGRDGVERAWTWDRRGQCVAATVGKRTTAYTYDHLGRCTSITAPDGAVTRAEFDAAGRLKRLKPALGLPVDLRYDAAGRALSSERRGEVDTTRHDGVGRIVERRSAGGRVLKTTFGLDDRPEAHEDHRGVQWRYQRDANDAVVVHAYDHITEHYTRDAAGEIVAVRAADGGERRYTPSLFEGLQGKVEASDGTEQVFLRDPAGRPVEITERAATEGPWGDSAPAVVKLVRDAAGRVVDEVGPHGHVRRKFTRDRLTSLSFDGARVQIERAPDGAVTAVNTPWGAVAVGQGGWYTLPGGATVHQAQLGYSARRADGVEVARHEITDGGEPGGRLRHERQVLLGEALERRYRLDADGVPQDATDLSGQPLAQRLSLRGHRVATDAGRVVDYDRRGRVTARPTDAGLQRHRYDELNRLTEVERGDGAVVSYRYDAFGRLIERLVDPVTGTGEHTTLMWSGDRLVGWRTPERTQRYVYLEPGDLAPTLLVDETAAGTTLYGVLVDDRGAVTALMDGQGDVAWMADYTAYGEANVRVAKVPQLLRFPGQWACAHTDQVYNRFRWYVPAWGRYLTPDPLGIEGGRDGFAYGDGDPFGHVDMLGLSCTPTPDASATPPVDGGGTPTTQPRAPGDTPGAGQGRGKNNLRPDPSAEGPHTTIKRDADGNVTGHAEWTPNDRNPTGFDQVKRVDTQHANPHEHNGVPTPHVHEGRDVRPARPDELPR